MYVDCVKVHGGKDVSGDAVYFAINLSIFEYWFWFLRIGLWFPNRDLEVEEKLYNGFMFFVEEVLSLPNS